eukprot:TRINITY_DN21678_c0_g4_i2.p1 TRINITY_DN21678_c0_g4~~TRINITY_DN21678_c0_g4_i2.p1  ORF type:complete len:2590 (-),score=365.62 TRINITY_DN21678_c0_g4_i2:336-8105(-)
MHARMALAPEDSNLLRHGVVSGASPYGAGIERLREELRAAQAEAEALREREASVRARFCAADAELSRLRGTLASGAVDSERLRGQVTRLEQRVADCEAERTAASSELQVARQAARHLSDEQAAALERASEAHWERHFQSSCFEARVEAVELQAEMAHRKQLHGLEQRLAIASGQSEHWRAIAGRRAEESTNIEAASRTRDYNWLQWSRVRDNLLQMQLIFNRWSNSICGRGSSEMWDMHAYYLHKQHISHNERQEVLRKRQRSATRYMMAKLVPFDNTSLLSRCVHVWSGYAKHERTTQVRSKAKRVTTKAATVASMAVCGSLAHAVMRAWVGHIARLKEVRSLIRSHSGRLPVSTCMVVAHHEEGDWPCRADASRAAFKCGVLHAWHDAATLSAMQSQLVAIQVPLKRRSLQADCLGVCLVRDRDQAAISVVLDAWRCAAHGQRGFRGVQATDRKRRLLLERAVEACGGAQCRKGLRSVLAAWFHFYKQESQDRRITGLREHAVLQRSLGEGRDVVFMILRHWHDVATGRALIGGGGERSANAARIVDIAERRRRHATSMVLDRVKKLTSYQAMRLAWQSWARAVSQRNVYRQLESQNQHHHLKADALVERSLMALAWTEGKAHVELLFARWVSEMRRIRAFGADLAKDSAVAQAQREVKRTAHRDIARARSLGMLIAGLRATLVTQSMVKAWHQIAMNWRLEEAAGFDRLRTFHRFTSASLCLRLAVHKQLLGLSRCLAAWRSAIPSSESGRAALQRQVDVIQRRQNRFEGGLMRFWVTDQDQCVLLAMILSWSRAAYSIVLARRRLKRQVAMTLYVGLWSSEVERSILLLVWRLWEAHAFGKPKSLSAQQQLDAFRTMHELVLDRFNHAVLSLSWHTWVQMHAANSAAVKTKAEHFAGHSAARSNGLKLLTITSAMRTKHVAMRAWASRVRSRPVITLMDDMVERWNYHRRIALQGHILYTWVRAIADSYRCGRDVERRNRQSQRNIEVGSMLADRRLWYEQALIFSRWLHRVDYSTKFTGRLERAYEYISNRSSLAEVLFTWSTVVRSSLDTRNDVEESWRRRKEHVQETLSSLLASRDSALKKQALLGSWAGASATARELERAALSSQMVDGIKAQRDSLVHLISCGRTQNDEIASALEVFLCWALHTRECKLNDVTVVASQNRVQRGEAACNTLQRMASLDDQLLLQKVIDVWRSGAVLDRVSERCVQREATGRTVDRTVRDQMLQMANRRSDVRVCFSAWQASVIFGLYAGALSKTKLRLRKEHFWRTEADRSCTVHWALSTWNLIVAQRLRLEALQRRSRWLQSAACVVIAASAFRRLALMLETFAAWHAYTMSEMATAGFARLRESRERYFMNDTSSGIMCFVFFESWRLIWKSRARQSAVSEHLGFLLEAAVQRYSLAHDGLLASSVMATWRLASAFSARTNLRAQRCERLELLTSAQWQESELWLLHFALKSWLIYVGLMGVSRREATLVAQATTDIQETHAEALYSIKRADRSFNAALALCEHNDNAALLSESLSTWRGVVASLLARTRRQRSAYAIVTASSTDLNAISRGLIMLAWWILAARTRAEAADRLASRRESSLEHFAALWKTLSDSSLFAAWRAAAITARCRRDRRTLGLKNAEALNAAYDERDSRTVMDCLREEREHGRRMVAQRKLRSLRSLSVAVQVANADESHLCTRVKACITVWRLLVEAARGFAASAHTARIVDNAVALWVLADLTTIVEFAFVIWRKSAADLVDTRSRQERLRRTRGIVQAFHERLVDDACLYALGGALWEWRAHVLTNGRTKLAEEAARTLTLVKAESADKDAVHAAAYGDVAASLQQQRYRHRAEVRATLLRALAAEDDCLICVFFCQWRSEVMLKGLSRLSAHRDDALKCHDAERRRRRSNLDAASKLLDVAANEIRLQDVFCSWNGDTLRTKGTRQLSETLQEARQDHESSRREVAEMQDACRHQMAELMSTHQDQLAELMTTHQNQLHEANQQLEQANLRHEETRLNNESLLQQRDVELRDARDATHRCEAELARKDSELARLEADLVNAHNELARALTEGEAELARVRAEGEARLACIRADGDTEIARISSQFSENDEEHRAKHLEHEQLLRQRNADLREAEDSLRRHKSELEDLRAQLVACQDQGNARESDLLSKIEKLQRSTQDQLREIKDLNGRVGEKNRQLEERAADLTALDERLGEALAGERRGAELARKEVEHTQRELEHARSEATFLRKEVDQSRQEMERACHEAEVTRMQVVLLEEHKKKILDCSASVLDRTTRRSEETFDRLLLRGSTAGWRSEAFLSASQRLHAARFDSVQMLVGKITSLGDLGQVFASWKLYCIDLVHEAHKEDLMREHSQQISDMKSELSQQVEEREEEHALALQEKDQECALQLKERDQHHALAMRQKDADHAQGLENREQSLQAWRQQTEDWAQSLRRRHETHVQLLAAELDREVTAHLLRRFMFAWQALMLSAAAKPAPPPQERAIRSVVPVRRAPTSPSALREQQREAALATVLAASGSDDAPPTAWLTAELADTLRAADEMEARLRESVGAERADSILAADDIEPRLHDSVGRFSPGRHL